MEGNITRCPHCQQKVRVHEDGLYRCPSCQNTFRFALSAPPPDSTPATPPAGASATPPPPQCEQCQQRAAELVCHECGHFLCRPCASVDVNSDAHCPAHAIERRPWALLAGLLRRPARVFDAMSTGGQQLGPALLFGVAAGVLGTILSTIYSLFAPLPAEQLLREMVPALAPMMSSNSPFDAIGTSFSIVFSPAYILVSIIITALVVHASLRLVGSGKNGLNTTIKVVSYAMVSAVLAVLPWIGLVLAPLVQTTLMVIGAARLHRTGYLRVTIAVLLPLVLLALFIGAAVFSLQTLIPSSLPLPTGKFI